jgi:hypothetical protein
MTLETSPQPTSRIPYTISVEQQPDGAWFAQVCGWEDCHAEAPTREAVISQLKQQLSDRLAQLEVVFIDLPVAAPENSWIQDAGMFANEPLFDDVLDEIVAYRRELDASRPELADLDGEI